MGGPGPNIAAHTLMHSNEEVHAQAWENLFVRRHECVVQHVFNQRDCGLTHTTSDRPDSQSGN